MNNEFYSERTAMAGAARKAHRSAEAELRKKFYVDADQPRTPRQVLEWLNAGHYDKLTDAELDFDHSPYDNPVYAFRFRKHEVDQAGYDAAKKKLDKHYEATTLDVQVLSPEDALSKVRTFEGTTFH